MVHEVSIDVARLDSRFPSRETQRLIIYADRLVSNPCLLCNSDRCRHGGHAHHIIGWFSKQKVCPVAGCDCECEFDGAIKLSRPAICVEADD